MIEKNSVEIQAEIIQGFQRIVFSGELVYGQTEKIREEIFSLLIECDGYILDLQNVTTIDSTGFGILVSIAKKLKGQNQNRMVVVINKPPILQLFKITKLTLIFPVVETKEEAVALLSKDLDAQSELSIDDY